MGAFPRNVGCVVCRTTDACDNTRLHVQSSRDEQSHVRSRSKCPTGSEHDVHSRVPRQPAENCISASQQVSCLHGRETDCCIHT